MSARMRTGASASWIVIYIAYILPAIVPAAGGSRELVGYIDRVGGIPGGGELAGAEQFR